jgi:hypothetical protein
MPRIYKGKLSEGAGLANCVRQAILDQELAGNALRLYWVDDTDVVAARSREEALEVMRRQYGTEQCRDLTEKVVKPIDDAQADLPLTDPQGAAVATLRARLALAQGPTWLGGSQ